MRKTVHQPHHSGQDCDKMPHQNTYFTRVVRNKLNVLTENVIWLLSFVNFQWCLMNQANIKELQNPIIYLFVPFFETQCSLNFTPNLIWLILKILKPIKNGLNSNLFLHCSVWLQKEDKCKTSKDYSCEKNSNKKQG